MTTAIHHASCCTSRVCLCLCLVVLVCTTHFHNCICCGKRSTYSHFRLWFINPSDSSQCTHSFISAVTFFPSKRTAAIFVFFKKHLLWKPQPPAREAVTEMNMVLTLMAARSRIITFPRKCGCSSFNFWFARLFSWTKWIMDAERKIHNRGLVSFQFLKLNYVKCCRVRQSESVNVCPENFKVLVASLCWELIKINVCADFPWDNNLSKVRRFKNFL